MVFLTRQQFAHLQSEITELWRPLAEFVVTSGARWGEVSALKPTGRRPRQRDGSHYASVEARQPRVPHWVTEDETVSADNQCARVGARQARLFRSVAVHQHRT